MLDTPMPLPVSLWLPLQPLQHDRCHITATQTGITTQSIRALPGGSCSIDALRDTFSPLHYSRRRACPPFSISAASTRDLPDIVQLHAKTLPTRYDTAFFLALLLNSGYTVLLARLQDSRRTIIGCATTFLNIHNKTVPSELELLTLCVDPSYSRAGIATNLLREIGASAISCSKSNEVTATLRVQITNIPALSLYTKLGFIVDEIEAGYYKGTSSGGSAAYCMKKVLS